MEKNGMDAATKGQYDSDEDVSLLDLPLEKQESTKNGKEVKNEAKAVPAASAASTKEEIAAEMRSQWKIQNRSQLSFLKVNVQSD
jgi:hypothetical protein